jgi:hypothetical protein
MFFRQIKVVDDTHRVRHSITGQTDDAGISIQRRINTCIFITTYVTSANCKQSVCKLDEEMGDSQNSIPTSIEYMLQQDKKGSIQYYAQFLKEQSVRSP